MDPASTMEPEGEAAVQGEGAGVGLGVGAGVGPKFPNLARELPSDSLGKLGWRMS